MGHFLRIALEPIWWWDPPVERNVVSSTLVQGAYGTVAQLGEASGLEPEG